MTFSFVFALSTLEVTGMYYRVNIKNVGLNSVFFVHLKLALTTVLQQEL